MKQFTVVWVDSRLPNSQPRRYFKVTALTRTKAIHMFNTRTSANPEDRASSNDKVIECIDLEESINNLVTSKRSKKTSHHVTR